MENKRTSIQELVDVVSRQTDFTKKFTEEFLHELIQVIQEYLEKDGFVKIKGLGTFKVMWNEERKSVNVKNQEEFVIPGHNRVVFIPENDLKDAVNKPYSHLSTVEIDTEEQEQTQTEKNEIVANSFSETYIPISEKEVSIFEKEVTTKESGEFLKPKCTDNEPPKKKYKKRIVFFILIIFVLLFVAGAYYYRDSISQLVNKYVPLEKEQIVPTDTVKPETIIPITEFPEDTLTYDSLQYLASEPVNPPVQELQYSRELVKKASIKETVIVKDGSRLTTISKRVYGHKAFWVYIYDANRGSMKSPNDIHDGMMLVVPDLDYSLVNPKSQKAIDKALELAEKYK